MSISGNTKNRPFSFAFTPPSHQTTTATVVHTRAPATTLIRRRDGEEAESSSSDHAIPRVSVHQTSMVSSAPFNYTQPRTSVHTGPLVTQPSPLLSSSPGGPNPVHESIPLIPNSLTPEGNYGAIPMIPYTLQQRRHTRDKTEVLNLKRGPNETVKEFILRYNLESLQINGRTEALMVAGFIHGVRDRHLIRKLHGVNGTPEDMNSLMTIAKAYVQQEKLVTASAEWEGRKNDKKGGSTQAQPAPPVRKSFVETSGRVTNPSRELGRYTPYTPREVSSIAQKRDEKREDYPALTKTTSEIWRTEAQKKREKAPKEDEKVGGKTVQEIYAIGNEAGSPRCDLKRRAEVLEAWMCMPLTVPASEASDYFGERFIRKRPPPLEGALEGIHGCLCLQHSDMTGIPREIVEHQLKIHPSKKPMVQKRRSS
ncbi:hypothetical protein E3N88_46282 [Mikania micrantha]|uniref:Uncharacterized protein n=1 Tax=Mikania micrantha TaxID=192012 RepID=A0A5N6L6P7_9ASTR|nr:hypothetical protein E3N88_46282 [Mikania micrantha]